jgi:hypothetical protein
VVVLPALPAVAQEATPAAADSTCTVAPRDVEELVGFYFSPEGTPLATPASASVDAETQLPSGEPVDAETAAAVNAVVAELAACFDAGQYARALALMTDDLARQTGPDPSNPDEDTPEEVRALLEAQLAGTPTAGEPGLDGAATDAGQGRDLRLLNGGQVGGIWTIEGDAVFLVFAHQDDRWLIDEIVDIIEDDLAPEGTPAP